VQPKQDWLEMEAFQKDGISPEERYMSNGKARSMIENIVAY